MLEGDAFFLEHREQRAKNLVVGHLIGVGPAVGQLDGEVDHRRHERQGALGGLVVGQPCPSTPAKISAATLRMSSS